MLLNLLRSERLDVAYLTLEDFLEARVQPFRLLLDRNILPDDLDCIGATPEKTISNIRNKYRCALSHA